MRTPLPPGFRGAGRTGLRLLAALALCACGGGGGGGDEPAAGGEARTAAASAAAPGPCTTPPPAVDTTLFRGEWAVLVNTLREQGAHFPGDSANVDTATVRLCPGCARVPLVIQADTTTYCATREALEKGQTLVMGIFVLAGDFPGSDSLRWPPMQRNDTLLVFASDTSGPATLVYNDGGKAAPAPPNTWEFYYCDDGHAGNRPQVKWRPRGDPPGTTVRGPRGPGDETGGSYGWMACASGCCQFYTPPPNSDGEIETPPGANPHAPDTVGPGHNRAGAGPPYGRPYWCKGRGG